ncbi:NAD(P)-dependent oxidoreductase, partial [Sinorhizobium meliloti]
MTTIAFIGFGEAAQSIAGGLGGRNAARLAAYDLRFNDPAASGALRARAAELGVEPLD